MKATVWIAAAFSYAIGGAATFAVIRWLGKGSPDLAFVVGAVLGTEVAAIVHWRTGGAGAGGTGWLKAAVGLALALSAGASGLLLHMAFRAFEHPDVSIPIGAAGAFLFPFVLFDTMSKTLSRNAGRGREK